MTKFFTIALLLAGPAGAASPDLDAVLHYESHSVSRNGVTQEMRFDETLIRRADHIWTGRVRPKIGQAEHGAETPNESGEHPHFDYEAADQHLSRDAAGALRLEYVDREKGMVVYVPPGEYAATGFGSTWASAGSLIEPAAVAAMPRSPRRSSVRGAVWHEETRGAWFNRVLWSEPRQIALQIESGTRDGRVLRRTTVQLLPPTPAARLPWRDLKSLTQREYDDFMD